MKLLFIILFLSALHTQGNDSLDHSRLIGSGECSRSVGVAVSYESKGLSKSFQPWCARASNLRGSISNATPLTASQRNAARNHAIHLVKWRKGRRKEFKIPANEGSTPSLTIAPHLAFTAELRPPYVDPVKLAKGDK